ncbi:OpgC domain-containing protein [Xylophilus sp.]|uniref:OpgC domain-containing protein n=1 Tax=Xylophilus sp. TaxID=2653893 RepID=UPI0013BC6F12|nr:OpgC domain-containing protein [Xylophilus sp.]KAF1043774.1 MAG: hypothetical protein GAK38_03819 [Xylophilus sp.]
MKRLWELDAARGLMLLLMTVTHLPTRLTTPLGQPFGFVSAAEGFVLLSAYMCGIVYGRKAWREGVPAMRRAFFQRALKVYLCQAALLLFLFTVIAAMGHYIDAPAVRNLISFYLHSPVPALIASLALIYQPALLDILPLYVLFMLASPWALGFAMRHGWAGVLAGSAGLWLAAQLGLSTTLYGVVVALTGLKVPFADMGAFNTFAWQLVWTLGLWLGARQSEPHAQPLHIPKPWVLLAVVVAVVGMVWRHYTGQAPFGSNNAGNMLFDKWTLAPGRLIDMLALLVVSMEFGPRLLAALPRMRWLEELGSQSLPVFCTHLLAVLLVLALVGDDPLRHAWWIDALLLAGTFALLQGAARLSALFDHLQTRRRARRKSAQAGAAALSAPKKTPARP